MYSWTSLFLQAGDAAMFNLSILTSDVYALLFSFLVEHVTPNWLYFVAFSVIFCGIIIYHSDPAPTSAEVFGLEMAGGETFGTLGAVGESGQWAMDKLACGRNSFFELRETSGNSGSTYCGSGGCLSDRSELGSIPPSPNSNNFSLL